MGSLLHEQLFEETSPPQLDMAEQRFEMQDSQADKNYNYLSPAGSGSRRSPNHICSLKTFSVCSACSQRTIEVCVCVHFLRTGFEMRPFADCCYHGILQTLSGEYFPKFTKKEEKKDQINRFLICSPACMLSYDAISGGMWNGGIPTKNHNYIKPLSVSGLKIHHGGRPGYVLSIRGV